MGHRSGSAALARGCGRSSSTGSEAGCHPRTRNPRVALARQLPPRHAEQGSLSLSLWAGGRARRPAAPRREHERRDQLDHVVEVGQRELVAHARARRARGTQHSLFIFDHSIPYRSLSSPYLPNLRTCVCIIESNALPRFRRNRIEQLRHISSCWLAAIVG